MTLPVFLGCSKYLDVDFVGDWQVKAHPKSNYENNNIAKEKIDFEGKLAWRTKIGKPLKASPLAVDSFLLIGSPGRRIYSIDLNSGEVLDGLWVDISIAQELFYSNGLLFITGDDDWNKLIALDLIRNEILWEKSAAASIIPPIAYDNKLYFTTRMGKLFCIDPDNGEKLWEFNLHDIVNTIPVFWANRVLHCNLRGDIFVLDADSGTLISELKKTGDVSSFPVKYESYIFVPYIDGRMVIYSEHGLEKISETKTESEYLSSPVIENNLLYTISKDGILYCIDYLEDQVLWKKNLEDVFVASPLIVNDLIFIGSINKMIYAFSKENGEKVFDYSVGGMVSSSAVYHRKKVYFAVEDGCVYAFE